MTEPTEKEVMTNDDGVLEESAKILAIELCGSITAAIELLVAGTKAEYWQGILDAIRAQNRIEKRRRQEAK